jgi:ribokinase
MDKSILVIGSANQDLIITLDHLPGPGETVIGGRYQTAFGGKGANQAVAAARAGGRVILLARLGEDDAARRMLEEWTKDGLDVSHILRDRSEPTGAAFIFVDRKGENCIGVASGANARLTAEDIHRNEMLIREAGCLLLQLEIPMDAVEAAVETASSYGTPVLLNPAPAGPFPARLLRQIDFLTPNRSEAFQLSGVSSDIPGAARSLLGMGAKNVIITLGREGLYLAGGECPEGRYLPAFPVEARDTTAAGDIFNGGLAAALCRRKTLDVAVEFGAAAAALSVTRLGAQNSAPLLEEIEAFLRERARRFSRN